MDVEHARTVAATVVDPELPVLTLDDLGVLRGVTRDDDGTVVVSITPTYSGCPAMATMRADLQVALRRAGYERVRVDTVLQPRWTTDWISDRGRRALATAGIAPPQAAPVRGGPVPLTLGSAPVAVDCPGCGSSRTEELSHFGTTACRSLHRCRGCGDTFDHVKAI